MSNACSRPNCCRKPRCHTTAGRSSGFSTRDSRGGFEAGLRDVLRAVFVPDPAPGVWLATLVMPSSPQSVLPSQPHIANTQADQAVCATAEHDNG